VVRNVFGLDDAMKKTSMTGLKLINSDIASHIHKIKHRIGVSVNADSARYKELKDKYLGFVSEGKPASTYTDADKLELRALEEKIAAAKKYDEYNTNPHFPDDPDVVVHLRLEYRQTVDGKSMLYFDELQSDWHQIGGEFGYKNPNSVAQVEELNKKYLEANEAMREADNKLNQSRNEVTKQLNDVEWEANNKLLSYNEIQEILKNDPVFNEMANERNALLEFRNNAYKDFTEANQFVPDAPFKDNWHSLGIKRILNYAAKNGYDRVGFSSANPQIKRWGTEEIGWEKMPKYSLTKDSILSSSSYAAVIVAGTSRSGPQSWIDEQGRSLKAVEEILLSEP
jgi:hypothetical protein